MTRYVPEVVRPDKILMSNLAPGAEDADRLVLPNLSRPLKMRRFMRADLMRPLLAVEQRWHDEGIETPHLAWWIEEMAMSVRANVWPREEWWL